MKLLKRVKIQLQLCDDEIDKAVIEAKEASHKILKIPKNRLKLYLLNIVHTTFNKHNCRKADCYAIVGVYMLEYLCLNTSITKNFMNKVEV